MKYCRNCQLYFGDDVQFCTFCGASFNVKYCRRRLHPNPIDARYCRLCGASDLSKPHAKPQQTTRRLPLVFFVALSVAAAALLLVVIPLLRSAAFPASILIPMIVAACLMVAFRSRTEE